jgi:hypothetical protein
MWVYRIEVLNVGEINTKSIIGEEIGADSFSPKEK